MSSNHDPLAASGAVTLLRLDARGNLRPMNPATERVSCFSTWDSHRCQRTLGHEGTCFADGIAWTIGRNIVVNMDGPPSATSQPSSN